MRLIFNNQVPTNILSYDFIGANLGSKMLVEQRQFMAYFSERRNISTHNTYLDHFVSLGFWGVLVSVLFVCVQVHSFLVDFRANLTTPLRLHWFFRQLYYFFLPHLLILSGCFPWLTWQGDLTSLSNVRFVSILCL